MLLIKKTVDLSSLGAEYKGIVLEFKSIPAKDLPKLEEKQKAIGEETAKVVPFFIEILQTQFVSGKQDDNELTKEDVSELDANSITYCFGVLTGVTGDPKAYSELTTTSSTEAEEAPKS